MSEEIEVINKLELQVNHIFNTYDGKELKLKMYDLAFKWYMKGFHSATECIEEWKKKI